MTTFEYMKRSVDMERAALEQLHEIMDETAFVKAIELLKASTLTVTSACGSSGFSTKKFAHSLCCVECPAKFVSPAEAVHGGLGYMKKGDVMLLVSRGGKTDELLTILDVCKTKGAIVIGVTENMESPLATQADIVLAMKVTKECDKYNCQGTTSFAVTNAIFDALQAALIEYTGYQKMDFALIHPGGAVGKRLNNK